MIDLICFVQVTQMTTYDFTVTAQTHIPESMLKRMDIKNRLCTGRSTTNKNTEITGTNNMPSETSEGVERAET